MGTDPYTSAAYSADEALGQGHNFLAEPANKAQRLPRCIVMSNIDTAESQVICGGRVLKGVHSMPTGSRFLSLHLLVVLRNLMISVACRLHRRQTYSVCLCCFAKCRRCFVWVLLHHRFVRFRLPQCDSCFCLQASCSRHSPLQILWSATDIFSGANRASATVSRAIGPMGWSWEPEE